MGKDRRRLGYVSKHQGVTRDPTIFIEKRQEKAKAEAEPDPGSASTPTAAVDGHAEDGGAGSGAEGEGSSTAKQGSDGTKDAHPPAQKYRLTEAMKTTVWQLVMLSNECCRLENEKKCVLRWLVCA